jgi:hypothetical protein
MMIRVTTFSYFVIHLTRQRPIDYSNQQAVKKFTSKIVLSEAITEPIQVGLQELLRQSMVSSEDKIFSGYSDF